MIDPSLFQISKTTNALGDDLFLDDSVGDIFADNEVFRVIKGASIRESLPRNYRESRERELQPSSHNPTRKRSPNTSNMGDLSRAGKRQRFHEPERPIPSIERFAVIDEEEEDVAPANGSPAPEEEDEDVPDVDEPATEEVAAPREAQQINGARVSPAVLHPPVVATPVQPPVSRTRGKQSKAQWADRTQKQPTPSSDSQVAAGQSANQTAEAPPKKRGPGRPRKSIDASANLSHQEPKRTPVSSSPILPPAKRVSPILPAAIGESLKPTGPLKSSQMLPPPIVPQRKPTRPSSPQASDATSKPLPAKSPAATSRQNGDTSAKKTRRVSFAEPSPPAIGQDASVTATPASLVTNTTQSTNGVTPSSGAATGSAKKDAAKPSNETVVEDDSEQEPSDEEEALAAQLQKSHSEGSNDKLGKRKAYSISPYEKEKLEKEAKVAAKKQAEEEKLKRKQAADEEKKKQVAEEKKQAADEKRRIAAEKKAEKEAAKEAKIKTRTDVKEAKRKEKTDRKLASSSQKTTKAESKADMAMPSASAPPTISEPITEEIEDAQMSGMADEAAAPPSSPVVPAEAPRLSTPPRNGDRSSSEAPSSPGSASTGRSDSRSPVGFVTASKEAAAKNSFPGSGQKQVEESESEEGSSSDEEDDDLDTALVDKPKTPATAPKEKAEAASTQSMRSTSYIPPPSQPRFSAVRGASQEGRRLSTTPIQPPAPKFNRDNSLAKAAPSRASDSPAPSQSQRPATLKHLPSLKNYTAEALANREQELERIKRQGQNRTKELQDTVIAKKQVVEESDPETSSSSNSDDSDSHSDSDSDAKATPENKRLAGLKISGPPASASKVEGKKKRKGPDFGALRKRFSMGSAL